MTGAQSESVKDRMQAALTAAMRARDEVTLSALRQALSAIAVAETAGAEQVVLSDDQAMAVLAVEVRQHHETADAFVTAGSPEKAERERAEAAVLEAYLPAALDEAALDDIIADEIAAAAADGATGMKAMGRVVSAVRAKAGPTADGGAIAAKVKSALAG
jgi:uncharacterized protein YqeY